MSKDMKHTIKGKHGHVYRILFKDMKKRLKHEPVCITKEEAARNDYSGQEISLREAISKEWKVCMWCWSRTGNKAYPVKGFGKKTCHYECDAFKCPAWLKPKNFNGLKIRKKK